MKASIGHSLINSLKPTGKQYDVRDSRLTGFLIRVTAAGKMNYVCEYKRGRRINIGEVNILTPAQARDRAKEILGDAAKGIDPSKPKKSSETLTFSAFLENEYKPWLIANFKRGLETYTRIKVHFEPKQGKKTLEEFDNSWPFEKWRIDRINAGIKPITVNRDIAALKGFFTKAKEWGFIKTNPLAEFKLKKIDDQERKRYLTEAEEIRFRKALDDREQEIKDARDRANLWRKARHYEQWPDLNLKNFADHIKPMILLTINTGLRRDEVFSLRWRDIDFATATLTVVSMNAKSSKSRQIPLNEEALSTLEKWRNDKMVINHCHYDELSHQLVFPNQHGKKFNNIKRTWATLIAMASIEDFHFHDLRHHFASCLVMAGVDLNTVRELLGHKNITMTLRYSHLSPKHKAEAVAKLGKRKSLLATAA